MINLVPARRRSAAMARYLLRGSRRRWIAVLSVAGLTVSGLLAGTGPAQAMVTGPNDTVFSHVDSSRAESTTGIATTSLLTGLRPYRRSPTIAQPAAPDASPALTGAFAGVLRAGGSVVLSGSPGAIAANPRTHTLYVPIQCPMSFCPTSAVSTVMDVVDTAGCNASVTTRCRVVAEARVGDNPLAATVDLTTDTVYVLDATGVTVVDGRHCNATVRTGCAQPRATIPISGFLVAAVVNPLTHTLYVADPIGRVDVVDIRHCSAQSTSGCSRPVRSVADPDGPGWVDVDLATDTVYAANAGPPPDGSGNTLSVIDGATCNATHSSGCAQVPPEVAVGGNPFSDAVDQTTHTVYVANSSDGTVSVVDGARCNAHVHAGCGLSPTAVHTGAGAQSVAIDARLHTAFTVNASDDTLSALDTRSCTGSSTAACPALAPNERAGPDAGPDFNSFPNDVAVVPATGTAYLANIGGRALLSAISVTTCNATDHSGCRRPAPSVLSPLSPLTDDPASHTLYAADNNLPQIDVVDTRRCHAHELAGCDPVGAIPVAGLPGAVDDATHTLYASTFSGQVAVVDTARCRASDTSGCSATPVMVQVGQGTGPPPALNASTRTVYLVFGSQHQRVAVIDAATCNAKVRLGCGLKPAVVQVLPTSFQLGVSAATDTIYAPGAGSPFATGHRVAVIDGAHCNGHVHSGCGHLAATVRVGLGPFGVAVDDATHTVYVANNADGDSPGTVSVIDGATCNGSVTSGCAQRPRSVTVGISPLLAVMDVAADTLYVTDFSGASVSVVDGSRCNASIAAGCRKPAVQQAVGSQPFAIALDPRTHTVYVGTFLVKPSMSIFQGQT